MTLSRHYYSKHSDEPLIKRLEGTKDMKRIKGEEVSDEQKFRNEIFNYIRKQADAEDNLKADLEDSCYCVKRSRTDKTVADFAIRSNCKVRSNYKQCCYGYNILNRPVTLSTKVVGKSSVSITDYLQKVLVPLRVDDIRDIINGGDLIIEYGNGYAFKHRHSPHLAEMIRSRLRLLARLLVELRIYSSEIKQYSDLFVPKITTI